MSRTWKGFLKKKRRRESIENKRMRNWIRKNFATPLLKAIKQYEAGEITNDEFEYIKENLLFNRKKLAQGCGLNYSKVIDYNKVSDFLLKERKLLDDAVENFEGMRDERYDKLHPDELFYDFIKSAYSWGVYPMYADTFDGHKLKVLERLEYLEIKNRIVRRSAKTMENIGKEMVTVDKTIPILKDIKKIPISSKGMLMLTSGFSCPFCERSFSSERGLKLHLRKEHKISD